MPVSKGRRMKRIIVCSDGTWNTPDQELPSNVTRLARSVLPTAPDGAAQVVFYDAGVGTEGFLPYRLVGAVSGKGIQKNIRDCYRFIMHNYEDNDEIYLFGFSRGAYTARSLAGMIRNVGLLHKAYAHKLQAAYLLYRRPDAKPDSDEARKFRADYSREAEITFIGVWDTVGALGIPVRGFGKLLGAGRHQFHDVELNRWVKHACHALAIDERRCSFQASLWKYQVKDGQIVEQVWFPGKHGDIGGTSGETCLEQAPFQWMAGRASALGLALNAENTYQPTRSYTSPGLLERLWRRLSSCTREIDKDDTQWLHPTAHERFEDKPSYRPPNLKAYLARPGSRIYGEDLN